MIQDVDENIYIDLNAGISTMNFGYNNPEIFQRALDLMNEYGTVGIFPTNDYNTPLMIDASKKLLDTVPNGNSYRVHYACDGTEANEAAIKTAISYTGRTCIVSFMGGFYGRTMGSLSAWYKNQLMLKHSDRLGLLISTLQRVRTVQTVCSVDPEDCNGICIEYFLKDRVLSYQVGPEEVVAFILEPYTTGGLMHPARPEFLKSVREITEENGIVLIFDEVQSDMGRSGKMWVHEHYDIEPDIFTCAKSCGGGVAPLSAAIIKDEIMENFPVYHGSTYGGAPISLVGNMAAIEYLKKYNLLKRVNELSKRVEKRFEDWRSYDNVYQARGWGLLKAVDFREDKNNPLLIIRLKCKMSYLNVVL